MSNYKIVIHIKKVGYPITSRRYKKAHLEANRQEKSKFGLKAFEKVQKIVKSTPNNELLGKHTKQGKIRVSSRVPKRYRAQVAYHERIEHKLMKR